MNGMSNATLLVVVTALSEKVTLLELINDGYASMAEEARTHIDRDHAQMDEMQETISDLRRQNERLYDTIDSMRTGGDLSHLKTDNDKLYAQVRQLKTENHKLRWGGTTPEETATNYMVKEGATVWAEGRKIDCIRVCRDASGWGLKETKDFCEAYMARKEEQKSEEVSGPGTKRSSQMPAGVGTNLKKSA